jgi:hypothetical protein
MLQLRKPNVALPLLFFAVVVIITVLVFILLAEECSISSYFYLNLFSFF